MGFAQLPKFVTRSGAFSTPVISDKLRILGISRRTAQDRMVCEQVGENRSAKKHTNR
jgi:hypothetical protein